MLSVKNKIEDEITSCEVGIQICREEKAKIREREEMYQERQIILRNLLIELKECEKSEL